MPVFGMNNGTIAIYSFNFGAGNISRVRATRRHALLLGFCVTLCVALLYELVPSRLLALFDASENMLSIGIPAIRILSLSLPLGAISIILSSSFQSLGKSSYSLFINLCRQMLVLLPVAWLLSLTGRLELIWISAIVAEGSSLLVSVLLNKTVNRILDQNFSGDNI